MYRFLQRYGGVYREICNSGYIFVFHVGTYSTNALFGKRSIRLHCLTIFNQYIYAGGRGLFVSSFFFS